MFLKRWMTYRSYEVCQAFYSGAQKLAYFKSDGQQVNVWDELVEKMQLRCDFAHQLHHLLALESDPPAMDCSSDRADAPNDCTARGDFIHAFGTPESSYDKDHG
ncbi:hypothetical protein N9L68_04985 [bacterium]|nr:hypothetical protein [bacterium]